MEEYLLEAFEECESCGGRFSVTKGEIAYGEDPYNSEINDDHRELWQCKSCNHESCMDI